MAKVEGRMQVLLSAPEAVRGDWVVRLSQFFIVNPLIHGSRARAEIRRARACVFVLDAVPSAFEWYAIGTANGAGKPVVLIAPEPFATPDWVPRDRTLILPSSAQPADVHNSIELMTERRAVSSQSAYWMEPTWPRLLERSREARGAELLKVVADAVSASGATVEEDASGRAGQPDMAFWVPDLPASSNPVLLEFKTALSRNDAPGAADQLAEYARLVAAPLAILLYANGPDHVSVDEPDVVTMSARNFVERLAREPLGRILASELLRKQEPSP